MRNHLFLFTSLSAIAACDGSVQYSDDYVIMTAPAVGAEFSSRHDVSDEAGIQLDVHAVTSLPAGESLTLSVVTETGHAVWPTPAIVDDTGAAVFSAVTVPGGDVTLAVEAGPAHPELTDHLWFSVVSELSCGMSVVEGPLDIPAYAPLRVLNWTNDRDPATPGFQATVRVATAAHTESELVVVDLEAGTEHLLPTAVASQSGRSTFDVSLANGRQALRAVCRSPMGTVTAASPTSTFFVDDGSAE